MPDRAVFLDKDGTLIDDVPFNVDPARITLAPGAREGLPLLGEAGYRLVVVTNQPGVALRYFPESALRQVDARLRDLLAEFGVSLSGFYYCPHPQQGGCGCRKPEDGLLRRAATDLDIDLRASWMVGDILNDVEAGNRAGCRTILIDNGNETEWLPGPGREPFAKVRDLRQAADTILRAGEQ